MVLQLNDNVFFRVGKEYEYGNIEKFSGTIDAIVLADNHKRYFLHIPDIYKIEEEA